MNLDKKYTISELISKLNGPIEAVGATEIDEIRYNNLVNLNNITMDILSKFVDIANNTPSYEYSVERNRKFAKKCIENFKTYLIESIENKE